MKGEVELKWEDPLTFKEIIKDQWKGFEDYKGVYLWIDKNRPEEVNYIGKTESSMAKRQFEHYLGFIGGKYRLPGDKKTGLKEWVCLYPGQKDEPFYDSDLVDWSDVKNVILQDDEWHNLVLRGMQYSRDISIYCAEVDEKKLGDIQIRDIERSLLWSLQPRSTKWGTRSKPQKEIMINHINAEWTSGLQPKILENAKLRGNQFKQ